VKSMPIAATMVLLTASAAAVGPSRQAVASPSAPPRPAAVTALSPRVTVQPDTGLVRGSVVHLAAAGLPGGTEVNLIECNVPTTDTGSGPEGCPVLFTPTTAADGTLAIDLQPRDLVFRFEPFGDDRPVYCLADICRLYVEWTDGSGSHSIHTRKMVFTGSPATIVVTPSTGLVGGQRVHVSGSAKGSFGRYVTIVEESCFFIVQGSGCDGALPLATFKLSSTDTYSGSVSLFRILGDGQDCADNQFGCELSVVVLNDRGLPDDAFGVSRIGQPAAVLTFQ
jgi:hypothetical protein